MPPRYAYWTILIDEKPTAFRAREREELLPTFHQLCRKNTAVVMKWFARGRLWESPEAAEAAARAPKPPPEKRGRDWRPGGKHRDPRDRFKKPSHFPGAPPESSRALKSFSAHGRKPVASQVRDAPRKPWQRDRPVGRRHNEMPSTPKRDMRSSNEPFAPKPDPPEKD